MARATCCLSCVAPSAPQYETCLRSNTPVLLGERKQPGWYRCSVTENGLVRNFLGCCELRNCRSTASKAISPGGGARSRCLRRQRESPAAWAASAAAAQLPEAREKRVRSRQTLELLRTFQDFLNFWRIQRGLFPTSVAQVAKSPPP